MKKETFIQFFTALSMLGVAGVAQAQTVEDADVSLSNLNNNSYWNSYDDNTKMVTGLNFMVLADGTNSNYVTPAFTIKVYIYDGSNPHFVKTFNDPGLYHFGSKDYTNESVDLSGLQLPAGTYQLGVFVDADDAIPNPPGDPNNNAYLLDGDINFTPGGGTSSIDENDTFSLTVYPNPTTDLVFVKWTEIDKEGEVELTLTNLQGQLVRQKTITSGETEVSFSMNDLAEGTYILRAESAKGIINRKITKR